MFQNVYMASTKVANWSTTGDILNAFWGIGTILVGFGTAFAFIRIVMNIFGHISEASDTTKTEMERAKAKRAAVGSIGLALSVFLVTVVLFVFGTSTLGLTGIRKI